MSSTCPRERGRRGGFTILEVLLAAACILIICGMIAYIFLPVASMSAQSQVRIGLQQEAMVIFDSLEADLRLTPYAAIVIVPQTVSNGHSGLSANRMQRSPIQNAPLYEDHLVVYDYNAARQTLSRKTWPPAPPGLALTFNSGAPAVCSTSDLQAILSVTNGTESPMSRHAVGFDVSPEGNGAIVVHVRLQQEVPSRPTEVVDMTQSYYVRNSS